jgi:ATP-dependent Clp protease ATP-binding subunit ClpA
MAEFAEYDGDPNADYTGFRYLTDAKTQRQYAVEFVKGVAKPPLRIFNPGKQNDALAPGETVYAFDDEQEIGRTVDRDGLARSFINAVVYKITAKNDEQGQLRYSIDYFPVAYDAVSEYGEGAAKKITLQLGTEAKEARLAGVPARFDVPASGPSSPLPPHAGGQASLARAGVQKLTAAFNTPPAPYKPDPSWKITDAKLEEALNAKWCVDLTKKARQGDLDPVIGRDKETNDTILILNSRLQASVCFTGEAGVGKSAMFRAVAQRLATDEANIPQDLQGARVIELNLTDMTAGTRYRGDFEERLMPIVVGLKERKGTLRGKKVILALDELHAQKDAGKADGASGALEALKPYMGSEGASILATTTDAEYRRYIEEDTALARRFEKKRLNSPDTESTLAILKGLWPLTRKKNHLQTDLTEEQLRYIVSMTNRYAPQEGQPSKSEKVMNRAASHAECEHHAAIDRSDIIFALAQTVNLPEGFLNMNDADRFLKMEEELPKVVVGQPAILRAVDGLVGARAGLNDPNQPWATYLLQGPTGVGKTQFAKALATYLFGDEKSLIKLDMADYQQEQDVSKITGAPPGYVGFQDSMPVTERIRQQPNCILLLDEIEKAHPKVFDKFLSVLNDGKLTDNHGRTVLFNNVIILMTTNLGAAEAQKMLEGKSGNMDWSGQTAADSPEARDKLLKEIYSNAIKAQFRPEMYNRIDEGGGVITFNPLRKEDVAKIARIEFEKMNKRASNADGMNLPGLTIEISDEAMNQIIERGYNPAMGARPLRKVLKEQVQNPLGKWMMLNRGDVEAFLAREGAAKLVISKLEELDGNRYKVTPELLKATAPAPANDDRPAPAKRKTTGFGPA